MAFCDEVGVGADTFEGLVQNTAIQIYWLSSDKYDVSSLNAFGKKSDYAPALRGHLKSDFMAGWNIVVPATEVRRLRAAYEKGSWKSERFTPPDIVILSVADVSQGRRPRDLRFRETFSNETFVVWVRD